MSGNYTSPCPRYGKQSPKNSNRLGVESIFPTITWSRHVVVPVYMCRRRIRVPIERIAASLLCLQTNRIKLSLNLHEASKTNGMWRWAGTHVKQNALTCRCVTLLHRKRKSLACTSSQQPVSSRGSPHSTISQ